jgi:WXG100 family type VII secretion target
VAATPRGGGELHIESDAVLAAADEFRSIADTVREGLQQLVSSANDVVDGSWRREAASAFNREWDEFRDAAKAIVEDADTIGRSQRQKPMIAKMIRVQPCCGPSAPPG